MCGIYMIKNLTNNKTYIGQSRDIAHRWSSHKTDLNSNRHANQHLQNSWNKYGQESFNFVVLEECNKEDLDEKEKYYIQLYDSYNAGYNLDVGGQGVCNFKHTDEQIRKMRLVQNPLGVLQFDLNFNLINFFEGGVSHASKTLGFTKSCILKRCEHIGSTTSYKDYYWVFEKEYNNQNFSWEKYLKQEWCCTIEKNKCKKIQRKIHQYDKDKNLIKIWDSFSDIEKSGYTRNQVLDICNHRKNKKTHKGYIWAYEDYDWTDGYFDNLESVYEESIKNRKKAVLQIDANGDIVDKFESRKDAAEKFGVGTSNISSAIQKRKICCGYFWANENDDWFKSDIEYLSNVYKNSLSNSPKEVSKFDLNGLFICSYKSRTEAAHAVGASVGNISRAISEHRMCNGFYWQ